MLFLGSILILVSIMIFMKVGKLISTPDSFRPRILRNRLVLFILEATPVVLFIGGLVINIVAKPSVGLVQVGILVSIVFLLKSSGSDFNAAKKIFKIYLLQKNLNPDFEESVVLSNTIAQYREAYSTNRGIALELKELEHSYCIETENIVEISLRILGISKPFLNIQLNPTAAQEERFNRKFRKRIIQIDRAFIAVFSRHQYP